MTGAAIDWSLAWPALAAGLLVTATLAPLGARVLERSAVFTALAVTQFAGLGIVLAERLGYPVHGAGTQLAALGASLGGAALLDWAERRRPEAREALAGVAFVAAASAAVLLLVADTRGAERMLDLHIGRILWVSAGGLAWAAAASAAILVAWFGFAARRGRAFFYVVLACAVTLSVQLVGLYLVLATLVVPALATRRLARRRLAACTLLSAAGYAAGLGLSLAADLPAGPLIVCTMAALGAAVSLAGARRSS